MTQDVIHLEYLLTDQLRANPWNPNQMTEAMFAKAINSIVEFGFVDPITVMPHGESFLIIDGEHRWRAAIKLEIAMVPCMVLRDVTEQQAKKLTPILNGLHGEADPAKLSELLRDLLASETTESLLRTMPFELDQFNDLAGIAPFDWESFSEKMAEPGRDREAWVERTYRLPEDAARVIDQAVHEVKDEGMPDWRALELVCADFLAGRGNGTD